MMPQNSEDLKLDNYDFELPEHLIAQRPTQKRSQCKLLVYDAQNDKLIHSYFKDINNFLPEKSTLVFNRSKVIPCRLFGRKSTGGQCEVVVLSLDACADGHKCLVRSSGKKRVGDLFFFSGDLQGEIKKVEEGHFWLKFNKENLLQQLADSGVMPIPPYIRGGEADEQDLQDYQTVYAKEPGSVAAPTAGLHFDDQLLSELKTAGHPLSYVTLHVGLGTFAPVKENDLRNHTMHTEAYTIDPQNLEVIKAASKRVAIGTTSLRALESSFDGDQWKINPGEFYDTNIFLYPGVTVHSIDALITNFHLPKSTLLMLVASLIGRDKTLEIYRHAIENEYRFYSYGDAMLILR